MEDELRFHREMETQKYLREGMSLEEARRRAGIVFAGLEPSRRGHAAPTLPGPSTLAALRPSHWKG